MKFKSMTPVNNNYAVLATSKKHYHELCYDALQQQKERRQIQAEAIENCVEALEELDLLEITFTDALWNTVVDHVTVYADKRLVFHCKNGSEVEVSICK